LIDIEPREGLRQSSAEFSRSRWLARQRQIHHELGSFMALFTRRKQGVAANIEDEVPPIARRAATIGELLRETRQQYGTSIEQVGATLRIRPAFLQAIEDDRHDRLPGPVYALGFVRTYADYLGLDGEAIAQRFKSEAAGLETKPDLSFPMPLPERSMPGGALLLVALIVAACAYAVWYYRAAGERARIERVAEVPSQLVPLPPAAAPASDVAPAETEAGSPQPSVGAAAAPSAKPPAGASSAGSPPISSPAASSPAANSPAASSSTEPSPGGQAAPPTPSTTPSGTATEPLGARPGNPPATGGTVATLSPSTIAPAAPAPPPQLEPARLPAIPPPPAAAPPLDAPRVFGVTNGPVRIVIKASADSWVQVREADQTVISMRVLKQGEIYRVPDRPGLSLRTGNAGGLEIAVDGRPVPPVGPVGKTRNVALDPDRLVAGSAALE
jgi:cytoskeleton protein RodZ